MTEAKRLQSRLQKAKQERQLFEPLLQDCYALGIPGRTRFYGSHQGDNRYDEIYDETGVVALQEYASRFQGAVTPNFTQWFELEPIDFKPGDPDYKKVKEDLKEIQEWVFDQIWNSNFASESHEAFLDMGISTGVLRVDQGMHEFLRHTALSPTETYIEAGPHDNIGAIFREREIKAGHLDLVFPKGDFSEALRQIMDKEQDRPLKVCEVVEDDYSNPEEEACRHSAFVDLEASSETIFSRRYVGAGSNPIIAFRASKASGETWGRGPFMNALAAVKTANLTVELVLQNAAMSLIGMYQADDDNQINPDTISLEPGAILPRAPGTRGLERVDTGGSEFNVASIILDEQRMNIKRALFNDMLSDPNKTPATAFEVSERMADLANRMGAAFGRTHYELVVPYGRRILWLGEKAGKIELPFAKGRKIRVKATSPLSLAQGQRDVGSLMRYHEISAAIYGPQFAMAQYDEKKLAAFLRSRLLVHEDLFRPIEQAIQGGAAMSAMAAQGAPVGGAAAATAGVQAQ